MGLGRGEAIAVAAVLVLPVAVLGADAWLVEPPDGVGYTSWQGLLPGADQQDRHNPGFDAAYIPSEGVLAVTTFGSSSCPVLPVEMRRPVPDEVHLRLAQPEHGPCTADLSPRTVLIRIGDPPLSAPPTVRTSGEGGRAHLQARLLDRLPERPAQ